MLCSLAVSMKWGHVVCLSCWSVCVLSSSEQEPFEEGETGVSLCNSSVGSVIASGMVTIVSNSSNSEVVFVRGIGLETGSSSLGWGVSFFCCEGSSSSVLTSEGDIVSSFSFGVLS